MSQMPFIEKMVQKQNSNWNNTTALPQYFSCVQDTFLFIIFVYLSLSHLLIILKNNPHNISDPKVLMGHVCHRHF